MGLSVALTGSALLQGAALGQPAMPNSYFDTALSFNACMQRAAAAMRDAGFMNIQTLATAVGGTYGDFNGQITCITPKGLVVVIVAGPDNKTALDHMTKLSQKMQAR